jgi:hypothetical protein
MHAGLIKKRTNEDYAATYRDANEEWRVNGDYAASERDANKAQRAIEGYAVT